MPAFRPKAVVRSTEPLSMSPTTHPKSLTALVCLLGALALLQPILWQGSALDAPTLPTEAPTHSAPPVRGGLDANLLLPALKLPSGGKPKRDKVPSCPQLVTQLGCNAAGRFLDGLETLFDHCPESCRHEKELEDREMTLAELEAFGKPYSELRGRCRACCRTLAAYYNDRAVIVSVHITHHAGTTLCQWATFNNLTETPYKCAQTAGMTAKAFTHTSEHERELLGIYDTKFVSFEYREPQPRDDLAHVDWEAPWVISVLVVRDPLERLLAADYSVESKYGSVRTRTAEQWWQYARDDEFTSNYQTRILGGGGRDALHNARGLVSRMSFVLDQHCLNANLERLGALFGWEAPAVYNHGPSRMRDSIEARIHNETVLRLLVERNRDDIEFYRWARNRSLVRCLSQEDLS